jgi:hypothetical protein
MLFFKKVVYNYYNNVGSLSCKDTDSSKDYLTDPNSWNRKGINIATTLLNSKRSSRRYQHVSKCCRQNERNGKLHEIASGLF